MAAPKSTLAPGVGDNRAMGAAQGAVASEIQVTMWVKIEGLVMFHHQ